MEITCEMNTGILKLWKRQELGRKSIVKSTTAMGILLITTYRMVTSIMLHPVIKKMFNPMGKRTEIPFSSSDKNLSEGCVNDSVAIMFRAFTGHLFSVFALICILPSKQFLNAFSNCENNPSC
jgi:hypothetical protein